MRLERSNQTETAISANGTASSADLGGGSASPEGSSPDGDEMTGCPDPTNCTPPKATLDLGSQDGAAA